MPRLITMGLQICLRTGLLLALTCAIFAQYWSADVRCMQLHLHLEAPGWVLQLGAPRPLQWCVETRDTDIEQCILNPFFEHQQLRVLTVLSGVAHELRQSSAGRLRMIGVRHDMLVFLMAAANVIWVTVRVRLQRRQTQESGSPSTA